MRFEAFVALRYLLGKRRQAFISVISAMSVLGVALGVGSLICVLGVMNGFSTNLRDKIMGVNAHVIVGVMGGIMRNYEPLWRKAAEQPGVTGAMPFIYAELMASTPGGVKGVVVRAIDPESSKKVLSLPRDLIKGSLDDLTPDPVEPGIIVGRELADRLGLETGSTLNMLSPTGKTSSAGFTPKVRAFKVAGIFRTGMYEYDSSMVFIHLGMGQEMLGLRPDQVSGLELRVADPDRADAVAEQVKTALGGMPIYARNWKDMNANLFAALELEKTAMAVVLALIVVVGCFSIIATLIMLVMEKTRDIAVLMSMGATRGQIRNIFMLQGTIIGLVGTVLGYAIGLSLCAAMSKYQFIKLPPGVYPMDTLPILLDPLDIGLVGVVALVLCFLATLYPSVKAASLQPVEALRYE